MFKYNVHPFLGNPQHHTSVMNQICPLPNLGENMLLRIPMVYYLSLCQINGELERFQVTNRDNDHDNDGNYQENEEYLISHKIIGRKKVDRYHNPYNVIIALGNGEISEVPLNLFNFDAPDECAQYAKENHVLDEPGWK